MLELLKMSDGTGRASELDQQETQLDSLRKNIQSTEAQRDKANDELESMIDNIQLESTF